MPGDRDQIRDGVKAGGEALGVVIRPPAECLKAGCAANSCDHLLCFALAERQHSQRHLVLQLDLDAPETEGQDMAISRVVCNTDENLETTLHHLLDQYFGDLSRAGQTRSEALPRLGQLVGRRYSHYHKPKVGLMRDGIGHGLED